MMSKKISGFWFAAQLSLLCALILYTIVGYSNPAPFKSPIQVFKFNESTKQVEMPTSKVRVGSINPKVLALATKAHQKAKKMGLAQKPTVTIIDYSLPSTQPRLWVVDMVQNKVLFHTHVAHGTNTGGNHAKHFSDRHGSLQSSLGVFVTGSTYQGKHGLSLTLHGLEKGINGNAASRRIVVHAANYVNEGISKQLGRLGRSWGCPALSTKVARPIIQTIKEGSLVFAYYPDDKWLQQSRFL